MILNENDYQAFVASIDLLSLHCPVCGVVGLFILYGHYKRFVILGFIISRLERFQAERLEDRILKAS